jgi:hypothetical protein
MASCRYCTFCVPDAKDGIRWEPIQWICTHGWAVVDGEHGCADYEREVGVDDDLNADLNEPFPDPYPPLT